MTLANSTPITNAGHTDSTAVGPVCPPVSMSIVHCPSTPFLGTTYPVSCRKTNIKRRKLFVFVVDRSPPRALLIGVIMQERTIALTALAATGLHGCIFGYWISSVKKDIATRIGVARNRTENLQQDVFNIQRHMQMITHILDQNENAIRNLIQETHAMHRQCVPKGAPGGKTNSK